MRTPFEFPREAFPEAPVRADDLDRVVTCIREGLCCSLVGLSNLGKSSLLKSLANESVQRQCAGEDGQTPIVVFIDCLPVEGREQVFYRQVLRSTIEALAGLQLGAQQLPEIKANSREILRETEPVARELFETSCRSLLQVGHRRCVLVLDEFDEVFQKLPPWPFRHLRAMYDEFKARVCYVLATSKSLDRLRSDSETDEFRELFDTCTHILQPLSADDSRRLIQYLARNQTTPPDARLVAEVTRLAGGHPGLLERVYNTLVNGRPAESGPTPPPTELLDETPIRKECARLWRELEPEEQEVLKRMAGGRVPESRSAARKSLQAKGMLIAQPHGGPAVFSPIFELFSQQQLDEPGQPEHVGLWYDESTNQFRIDDRDISGRLSRNQSALLSYLWEHPERVCLKDELGAAIWPDMHQAGITDEALYQLVQRLRNRLKQLGRSGWKIKVMRGKGYQLTKGEE